MARRSIRFRITALAVLVVVVVLVLSSVLLVLLQRTSLTGSLDEALTDRAERVFSQVQAGKLATLIPRVSQDDFVQVLGPDGLVTASTPNLASAPALPIARPTSEGDVFDTRSDLGLDDDHVRVLSRALPDGGMLIVATSYDVVAESTAALVRALAWTVPPVAAALGALIWWIVGRSLRPVAVIRSEVAEIELTDLSRRVQEPGTGDEIDQLAATMNAMLARLEMSAERQRRFVADASHELRSPLTRMRTTLEVDLASGDSSEKEVVRSALEDVLDMQETVEDLLYLARADEGCIRLTMRELDVDDIVLREARRIATRGRVDVDVSGVSGAHVEGDPGQLARAIRNLLENAERHAVGRVALTLREDNGQAVLTIVDDGPGIPAEHATTVFERFSRLDSARSAQTGGVGLGLPITRDIVDRHHGTVLLRQCDGPGATFEVRLPLA